MTNDRRPVPLCASLCVSLAAALIGSACASDPCATLGERLEGASAGDVVTAGACVYEGSLTVPAGVTLEGAGADVTIVQTPDGVPGVVLEAGAVLRGLRVEGGSLPGVAAVGTSGEVRVEDVEVVASRGVAMRVSGLAATLVRVQLRGPVTAANATEVPVGVGPEASATHGLVLVNASPSALEDVTIEGFAGTGALMLDSEVHWSGGALTRNLIVGLRVSGGAVTLVDVEVNETLQGVQPRPAFAAVFTEGAEVNTEAFALRDNEGVGALHVGGVIDHLGLLATDNRDVAVWVQAADELTLAGTATEPVSLLNNRFAGVVLADTPRARLEHVRIEGTTTARHVGLGLEAVDVGDGLQAFVADPAMLTLSSVAFVGNERVGALFDIDVDTLGATLTDVSADGPTEAFGVVAQRGASVVPVEATIARSGGPAANDAAFSGELPVFGIIGPMFLPPTGE